MECDVWVGLQSGPVAGGWIASFDFGVGLGMECEFGKWEE